MFKSLKGKSEVYHEKDHLVWATNTFYLIDNCNVKKDCGFIVNPEESCFANIGFRGHYELP
jgi:hypothetical protein